MEENIELQSPGTGLNIILEFATNMSEDSLDRLKQLFVGAVRLDVRLCSQKGTLVKVVELEEGSHLRVE